MDSDKKNLDQDGVDRIIEKAQANNIGRIPARELMTRKPITILPKSTISYAIEVLQNHRISGLPVTTDDKKLLGLISEYDLLLQAAKGELTDLIKYRDKVLTVQEDTPLKEILITLYSKRIRRLPVVDKNNYLVGIVSRIDVLAKLSGKSHKKNDKQS
ncbi:MAG: CBS domain-containing protein [Halobacteriovoraceae bacterium]|nr:CBS domain-containing protein [Halobacteriovoraceae bacterium]